MKVTLLPGFLGAGKTTTMDSPATGTGRGSALGPKGDVPSASDAAGGAQSLGKDRVTEFRGATEQLAVTHRELVEPRRRV